MLAFAKSETTSYTPPTEGLLAEEIEVAESGENRRSYTVADGAQLYTVNLRIADAAYSFESNLWDYTGNTNYISANQILVDIYGYSIDLSFRTNDANSALLLQTDAVNRISDDESMQTETSIGAGSYMKFEILDSTYSTEMAMEYMSSLRVVFTDTNTGYIYGYAALDMTAAEVDGSEIKAPLRLYDKDSGLKMEGDASQYLCSLKQNQEKNLTVYVYLDGASVSESCVSATGDQTLSGVLNLQFSSSADLQPAKYTGSLNAATGEEESILPEESANQEENGKKEEAENQEESQPQNPLESTVLPVQNLAYLPDLSADTAPNRMSRRNHVLQSISNGNTISMIRTA